MFWFILCLILLAALAALCLFRLYLDRIWQRDLRYLNRHEHGRPSENGPSQDIKTVWGAKPNFNSSRAETREADESRAVYERTVEKLRELSPKRYRRLKPEIPPEHDNHDSLPIFSAHADQTPEQAAEKEQETVSQTVSEDDGAAAARPDGEPAAERITEDETSRSKRQSVQEIIAEEFARTGEAEQADADENPSAAPDPAEAAPHAPDPDAPVITPDEIGRFKRKSVQEIIEEEFARTHEGEAAEDGEGGEPETEAPPHAPAPDAPVITEAELGRFKREPAESIIEKTSPEAETRKPAPDAQIITLEELQRAQSIRQNRRPAPAPVAVDDPVFAGVRERAELRRIERDNRVFSDGLHTPPPAAPAPVPAEETAPAPTPAAPPAQVMDEGDIRSNLLRQRSRRLRPTADTLRHTPPRIIAEEEVRANLVGRGAPETRRLRRVSTVEHASFLPAAAPVSAYGGEVVKNPPEGRARAAESPLPRTVRTVSRMRRAADVPPPDATVVEPPAVPDTPPLAVDVPPPAALAFSAEMLPPWEDDRPSENGRTAFAHNENPYSGPADVFAAVSNVQETQPQEDGAAADWADAPWNEPEWPSENPEAGETENAPDPYAYEGENLPAFPVELDEEGRYPLPDTGLLLPASHNPEAEQTEEELLENSITIEEKLAEFRVKVKVLEAYAGPVITRYEIEPDVGVRGNAVMNLEKDLARSLGVASIRVVETIPGKTCMGLELPNPKRQMIRLSEIFASPAFTESQSKLTLALGQDITGNPVVTDLARAPHLLVAGTTGSGKSVGVNAMILSLLFKARPEDVRMIMIDPKMLELSIYEGIPHLLAPVVTDMRLAANALAWCVNEMEKRYRLMSHLGVRNLAGYNQKIREEAGRGRSIGNPFSLTPDNPEPLEKLPFIVVVVDEFADLMMTAGKKIEELIARITQKARAAGIHLILATQRPSVDVITGLIKANIPTRIAFQVSSKIDSRTILDQMGAENLLGQGDMLFLPPGTGYPRRVHGAFASDAEVHGVVEYLKQFGDPAYVEDILTGGVGSDDMFSNANEGRSNEGGSDPLYDEAVACVVKTGKATISSVQRHLKIGYNRAANLIEQMEADGIISAADTAGKRTVLARDNSHLDA